MGLTSDIFTDAPTAALACTASESKGVDRNFNQFDLNLIKTFLTIWELGSLTATGDRLALSQPAVSHALRKLREQFSDPLFVRVGNRMHPTEAAARLHEPFGQALRLLKSSVRTHGDFFPASATRTFKLAMSDLAGYLFLADLFSAIRKHAPSVRIEIIDLNSSEIENSLRSGQVDLALGYVPSLSENCLSEPLLHDSFVVLVRKDHPFQADVLSEADFVELTYLDAANDAPGYHQVERQLSQLTVKRKVAARLNYISVAPEIVLQTDLAAIYPTSVSRKLNRHNQFRLLSLPFEISALEIGAHRHRQFLNDEGIGWMAEMIRMNALQAFGPLPVSI